jgi:hypothetical protein
MTSRPSKRQEHTLSLTFILALPMQWLDDNMFDEHTIAGLYPTSRQDRADNRAI